jgi:hypothetical protein
MALDGTPRTHALRYAMAVAAAELFAAQGAVAGGIALACLGLAALASRLEWRAREWAVAALAAHVVLGMAGGLYERSAVYDKLVHAAVCFGLARRLQGGPAAGPRWLAPLAALGLGALWELFEFAADATGLVTAQRGLADTMLDLAADAAGALAAAPVARATLRECARSSPVSSTGPPFTRRSRSR